MLFNKIIIIDSHTSGIFPFDGKYKILNTLSRFIQRKADITIVTNSVLQREVEKNGGRGLVLPDRLPRITPNGKYKLKGKTNVVYICSFSWDEPYLEVIKSSSLVDNDMFIYITGNYKKVENSLPNRLPINVILTGFLAEADYANLLNSADIIMDLTTREHCLLCGAYEAIALEKPYILSKTEALMEYFTKGCLFTENNKEEIANTIKEAAQRSVSLGAELREFKERIEWEWNLKFDALMKIWREL